MHVKPMLAVEAPKTLTFPLFASAKLDGIRCVIKDGSPLSRTLKPIPNDFIRGHLSDPVLSGLDGELIVGSATDAEVYRRTSSGVMSQAGQPAFTYFVFDYFTSPLTSFESRYDQLSRWANQLPQYVQILPQRLIKTEAELLAFEHEMLQQGFEGLILRSLDSPYKFGRSTAREGYMLKLKRFTDGEATVTGFEELMHNGNEATTSETGNTKRSSHQENLVPMDTLGALQVVDVKTGVAFKIGTGYTAQHRKQIWNARASLVGAIVKYKHFEIGVKDAPRFPVWLGFRDPIDL